MSAPVNVYVDDGEGRTYRVCFYGSAADGRVLLVGRQGITRQDTGPYLNAESRKAKALIAKARKQAEEG